MISPIFEHVTRVRANKIQFSCSVIGPLVNTYSNKKYPTNIGASQLIISIKSDKRKKSLKNNML